MIESEWTSKVLGRPVIKAFNNVVADSLLHKAMPKGSKHRIALPVSGADPQQKKIIMQLINSKRLVWAGCTWCCFAMMMCGWFTQI
jgi:predicted dinucleotide-binding enzyme